MTREEIQLKIQQMKTKKPKRSEIYRNPNGTWSNVYDREREWADLVGCQMDVRFHKEWARKNA